MTEKENNLTQNVFKVCTKCRHEWPTRKDFLDDTTLSIIGYQASFTGEDKGYFLFNHLASGNICNTTLTVEVSEFWDMYDGPIYEHLQYGSETCSGHCARTEDLSACDVECRNAPIRDILQKILNYSPLIFILSITLTAPGVFLAISRARSFCF